MNNYEMQALQAKRRFLTYDQQELIFRCRLKHDGDYFYFRFLGADCRLCRKSGDMERWQKGKWTDGNSYGEVMTVLDWLCDSRADRYTTGRFVNVVTQNHYFHRSLQEDKADPDALLFSAHPEAFCAACEALGGQKYPGADISYAIELVDGLQILVQLWHGDEEFPSRLCCLWDENVTRYIRYETTWYAVGLLLSHLRRSVEDQIQ